MKTFLYDKNKTQLLEKLEKEGIPNLLPMRAGFNIYQIIKNKFIYDEIIIIAGPGNNGGDAIALAIQAKLNNDNVILISLKQHKNNSKKLLVLANSIGLSEQKMKSKLLNQKETYYRWYFRNRNIKKTIRNNF